MMTGYEILGFEKVNDVDDDKVSAIADAIKSNGWQGAPILTYGNILITGSHRLAALELLCEEGVDISFDCAEDVSDIIDQQIADGREPSDIFTNLDDLKYIFAGTRIEEYKDEIEEW